MREKIRNKLPESKLCFSIPTGKHFAEMVEFAYNFGATHINIGELPFRYNEFLPDNSDPYPNWSQQSIGIFRVTPPEPVREFIPASIVEFNQQTLDEYMAVIRKYNLKACLQGTEPLWLPEAAYRKHPLWRGVQCELGRIAGKSYFAPAIDEPEVLELYREAMVLFCQRYPEFDFFNFWTNDCGSGVPWSTYSYPGVNGPIRHRMRNPGARIVGWMKALQQGVEDAGHQATVNLGSFSFPPAETAAVTAQLGDDLYFNGKNGSGVPAVGLRASLSPSISSPNCSIPGVLPPQSFADGFVKILQEGNNGTMNFIGIDYDHRNLAASVMENALSGETSNPRFLQAAQALYQAAVDLTDSSVADQLCDAWKAVEKAIGCMNQVKQRGLGSNLALMYTTGRWLYRPLVPEPMKLTDSEKRFFSSYLFSAGTEEQDADLCYLLGKPVFIGDGVVWMARWILHEAAGQLGSAAQKIESILSNLTPEKQADMTLYRDKLKAWQCVMETGKNTIMYQHALNIMDQPRFAANPLDFDDNIQFDQRALELRKIARMELDNMMALVNLIKQHEEPLFDMSETVNSQTVFLYGPDFADALQHKMNVMLDHWHDYECMFPTSKVYEFEPTTCQRSQPTLTGEG